VAALKTQPNTMTESGLIVFSLIIGALIWLWVASLRAREQALSICRRLCKQLDMQLLDQTVALSGVRVGRDLGGRPCLLRRYGFEFSPDGQHRYPGRLFLHGARLMSCQFDLPDGTTVISPDEFRGQYT
jgi:hypothetical protein